MLMMRRRCHVEKVLEAHHQGREERRAQGQCCTVRIVFASRASHASKHDTLTVCASYSPPFVRNGVQGRIDDPFTSPHRHASAQRTPTGPKFMNRAVISDNWRSGSSSGSPSDSSSPAAEKALRSAQSGRSVTVRDYGAENVQLQTSEQVIPIKAEDAQAHYPPSSCVFVAK